VKLLLAMNDLEGILTMNLGPSSGWFVPNLGPTIQKAPSWNLILHFDANPECFVPIYLPKAFRICV
jgi:hypothetical protein